MNLPLFLDCTLRDGGYINDWNFSWHFAKALYRAVSQAGADYIEAGFFEPGNDTDHPWTNLRKEDLEQLRASLPSGTKIAVMINYGSVNLEDVPHRSQYPADMIRVAAPGNKAREGTAFSAALTAKGYETTINYMGASNYTNAQVIELIDIINEFKDSVGFFYVADSFGGLLPSRTREIFTTLRFGTDARLGFHPHNNLQMAFANCIEAIEAGIDIVDGSVFGMGRGAGNLFSDAVIAYFETIDPERFHVMPLLQFADLYMEEMKERYSWGYSLPQLLSGILRCHPNYPTNLLKEKAYTADDILRMLRNLPEADKPRYSASMAATIKEAHFKELTDGLPVKIAPGIQSLCARNNETALLICGGRSVAESAADISAFIASHSPSVFSVNNPKTPFETDGVFFGNRRRILQYGDQVSPDQQVILGYEIHDGADIYFNQDQLTRVNILQATPAGKSPFPTIMPTNSAIEAILGLVQCGYRKIYLCGLDGYAGKDSYYYNEVDKVSGGETMEEQNAIIARELDITATLAAQAGFTFGIITPTLFAQHKI